MLIKKKNIDLSKIDCVQHLANICQSFLEDSDKMGAVSTAVFLADLGDDGWGGRVQGISLCAYDSYKAQ